MTPNSYVCVMKEKIDTETTTLGVEVSPKQIAEFLKKDLAIAINCLSAIHSDPDMMDSLAAFMYGRYLNFKNKPENPVA